MRANLKLLLRKIRIMAAEKLVSEETLAALASWDMPEIALRCDALGIDQRQVFIDRFRNVTQEAWDAMERRLRHHRSKSIHGDAASVAVELSRDKSITPPAKSLEDLEAGARTWHKAGKPYASFVGSVWADILALTPVQGPEREWLCSGLKSIAAGSATKLEPRPSGPPAVSAEEFHAANAAAARKAAEDHAAMRENEKAGRGRVVN